jgi:hypothetical protein
MVVVVHVKLHNTSIPRNDGIGAVEGLGIICVRESGKQNPQEKGDNDNET